MDEKSGSSSVRERVAARPGGLGRTETRVSTKLMQGRSEQTVSNRPEGQMVRVSGSQQRISQRWSVHAVERYAARKGAWCWHSAPRMHLACTALSERRQTQEATQYMVPLTRHTQNGQTHSNRKQAGGSGARVQVSTYRDGQFWN